MQGRTRHPRPFDVASASALSGCRGAPGVRAAAVIRPPNVTES
ncbi:hypothetical protein [Agromyces sp. Soil535]|nr:hypothetical protein [Agromyces sp. Soil535]